MYANRSQGRGRAWRRVLVALAASALVAGGVSAVAQELNSDGQLVRTITRASERLEMTVNTSQIITLGTRIPRLVVNNPEIVTATPISETQVQLAARKSGVTQVNLWDENGRIFTVDLMIFGDVRELELALKRMFPGSTLKVVRLTNSLVLEGQVDRPEIVSTIRTLAEDYAPKVVNNITVGGVQQVMLKVKVMEVSRTKLRRMGFDFAEFNNGDFIVSGVSGIVQTFSSSAQTATAQGQTVSFGVIDDNNAFLGFLQALQQNAVSKILADPTITAISGRPASFNVGGELPILVPSGLGQTTIEYKKFGTQVDFVPIVLGDGNIRLEVRPRVSEIDDTRSVTVNSFTVPALKVREVDTGVEMKAGQTLALAGLIQERVEANTRGFPLLMDLPGIGGVFRKVEEQRNEIELLILVTPEYVDAMDPCEVPQCGPGMETMSPTNGQLYWKGMIEVPACGPCGASDYCACTAPGLRCEGANCSTCGMVPPGGPMSTVSDGYMPPLGPTPAGPYEPTYPSVPAVDPAFESTPSDVGPAMAPTPSESLPDPSQGASVPQWYGPEAAAGEPAEGEVYETASAPTTSTPGLIGPIGYDVQK